MRLKSCLEIKKYIRLLSLILLIACVAEAAKHNSADAKVGLRGLSLEDKVGQMLEVRVYGSYTSSTDPEYVALCREIDRYHVGSVVLGAHIAGPNLAREKPIQIALVLNDLQRRSKLPLLVGADIERGVASRVSGAPDFPFPMALGATNDPALTRTFGAVTATEARAIGIQLAFAPVADVNDDPDNPIVGDRSFGEDPELVGRMVAAFIRGAHSEGLLVTAKHFPGHGDTGTDSHVGIVNLDQSLDHLKRVEFPPFEQAIQSGVDAVMLAHAKVPALDPDPNKIATTSSKIIEGTLRHDLGFRGVVITDALEMKGLTSLYPGDPSPTARAAVDAVKAGADIIMIPTDLDGAYHGILDAVKNGEIPESRIDESVRRILAMKAAVGLDRSRFVDINKIQAVFDRKQDWEFAQEISDEAVTLVRNSGDPLPLESNNATHAAHPRSREKAQHISAIIFSDAQQSPLGKTFESDFLEHRPDAHIFHVYYDNRSEPRRRDVISAVEDSDQVVVAAFMTNLPGRKYVYKDKVVNVFGLVGPSSQLFSQILGIGGKKVTVVALGSPYLILHYPIIQNYICTYSTASTSERSAVKALFGEIHNHATLPVTLPGVADRGFFLPWPSAAQTARQ